MEYYPCLQKPHLITSELLHLSCCTVLPNFLSYCPRLSLWLGS